MLARLLILLFTVIALVGLFPPGRAGAAADPAAASSSATTSPTLDVDPPVDPGGDLAGCSTGLALFAPYVGTMCGLPLQRCPGRVSDAELFRPPDRPASWY